MTDPTRPKRWLRYRASLRTRVAIAAAIAAAAVVGALVVLTSFALASNDSAQLDRRLDAIVDASTGGSRANDASHAVFSTGRSASTGEVVFQRGLQLPQLPPGTDTVTVNGVEYRVRTVLLDRQGILMSIGIRTDSILLNSARIPLYVGIAVVALFIAGSLGWLLGGAATRPLRRLTEQTQRLGQGGVDQIDPVRGVKEAEDLSEAMIGMLLRLAAAQASTTQSLQAAQDFAANAAHELRTPLTAMRADLDTLRIHDLPPHERDEVVADLARAQRRVEATITALGQLASGQLAQAEDRELVDIEELLDRVARENTRPGGTVEIVVDTHFAEPADGVILGWPGGLRLAVDNLVRNAITHGRASRIVLTARRDAGEMAIIVDDNGCGLPADEHEIVLGRFSRGSTAASGGSGLGLALVAQQAALHGGHIELSDGPLGGLRATLTVATPADG
ncbi:HAMP domain-containing sensor histidine kinase [Mycolicibacterium confluentis]|uniref:histidine kinase n=1 Tax=Mycolicibacterium confluentis TaxID=28047 RepID=A0A7I7Y2H3_9MYCO|nr:HAMP domain-containing sensor histidine kinase [Mycolicibacterium confluentis]MCV7322879.1 HAMP domain-containing histidine kinase [Mycolicibacterium confluentis]ORV20648.1 ATPase [Mycolicibacterium confluentis]BBZ35880.1 two-component sensor histidine kinase [Mycolicibacterium confluentis]